MDKYSVNKAIFDLYIKTKATKGVNEGVSEVHFKGESEGVNDELNAIYSVIEKLEVYKSWPLQQLWV